MRRREDEFTPPTPENAFHPQLLDELRRRDPSPALPDGDFAGPWRVTRLWGDGPPLWACYAAGERTPRLTFEEPDLPGRSPRTRRHPPARRASSGTVGGKLVMMDTNANGRSLPTAGCQ